jgi:hypothetical protein
MILFRVSHHFEFVLNQFISLGFVFDSHIIFSLSHSLRAQVYI